MNFVEVATLVALATGAFGLLIIALALWELKKKRTNP